MNCPSCGAAMRLVESRQHFVCAHCGKFHFPEETGDGVTVLGEVGGGNCPHCQQPIVSALLEGERIYYCEQCRGFLAGLAAFGRVVTRRRATHGPNERRTDPFDPAELRRSILCPNCDRRMEAHPYGGGGNAVVDTCSRCCLIWLDAGELAIIERYIPYEHKIEPALRGGPGTTAVTLTGGVLTVDESCEAVSFDSLFEGLF